MRNYKGLLSNNSYQFNFRVYISQLRQVTKKEGVPYWRICNLIKGLRSSLNKNNT